MQANQNSLRNSLAKQATSETCYERKGRTACMETPVHEEDWRNNFIPQEELVMEEFGWIW